MKMVITALLFLSFLSCLGKREVSNSHESTVQVWLPQQQIEFCNLVTDYRNQYRAEFDKENYIDKRTNLRSIFSNRTSALQEVLGNGVVNGWKGKISEILVSEGKGVFLSVSLPCKAQLKPQDNLIIRIGTPLYESLRKYQEKQEVTFSGNFLISPTDSVGDYPYKAYYGEQSFSESGSMDNPEFLFLFKELNN
jgi:hypothetical protein